MPEISAVDEERRPKTCKECEATGKVVWPPSSARPHFAEYSDSGWFDLVVCMDCGRLWVQSPYEPYASFIYVIYWPYSREFWSSVVKIGDGELMGRWSSYKIRQAWPTMSNQDREAVEFHRRRSYGRNPTDEPLVGDDLDPLEPILVAVRSNETGA